MTDNQTQAPDALSAVAPELIERYRLDRIDFERPTVPTADLLRLDGRTAFVTGGGGDGSGNAICHRLAEQGASVVVVDIAQCAADATAAAVADRWGTRTLTLVADIGEPEQVADAVAAATAELGGIDILVNNAGGSGAIGRTGERVAAAGTPFADMDLGDLDSVVRVNLLGTYLVTKAVLPGMLQRGRGRIVNIASDAGRMASPGIAVYASCKAAVINFTQSLGVEVGRSGVSTVAVCPGTMLNGRALTAFGAPSVQQMLDDLWAHTSVGRFSVPDEVASVVAFLASDAGSLVHGTAVSVSGGLAGV